MAGVMCPKANCGSKAKLQQSTPMIENGQNVVAEVYVCDAKSHRFVLRLDTAGSLLGMTIMPGPFLQGNDNGPVCCVT